MVEVSDSGLTQEDLVFLAVNIFVVMGILGTAYIFYPAIEAVRRSQGYSTKIQTFAIPDPSSSPPQVDNSVLLTLVIPAYNEEARLQKMLQATQSYLSIPNCLGLNLLLEASNASEVGTMVEWILVNDGSNDRTSQVYESFVRKQKQSNTRRMSWRLCTLSKNSGKGAAVQAGMLMGKGKFRLMVDADGATEFGRGLEAVAQYTKDCDFVFGSRAAATDDGDDGVQRSWVRQILQAGFHAFVVLVVGYSHVKDTQCGFKLFEGSIAQALFHGLHLHRWAFDTELFVRARLLDVKLKEVPVPWQEIEGSKLNTSTLNLIRVAIGMLRDMICVRLCYSLRIWTIENDASSKKER